MAKQPSRLTRVAATRIVAVALTIWCLELLETIYENFGDETKFAENYVSMEVKRLRPAIKFVQERLIVDKTQVPKHFTGEFLYHYSYRIRDVDGRVIAASNSQILENAYPVLRTVGETPFAWLKLIDDSRTFQVAGGRPAKIEGKDVWIEVATLGDPAWQRLRAIWWRLQGDILFPLLPLTLAMLGFVVLTIRSALEPVVDASRAVATIDGRATHLAIDHDKLPAELAVFTRSIDGLLQRNTDLLEANRRLLLHAAHELRTPLATMMLELGRSKDPASRRLIGDVAHMRDIINRLLSLGRLLVIHKTAREDVDLAAVVSTVARNSRAMLEEQQCTLEIVEGDVERFHGDPSSIYDAVRNLLENAVKHTPAGSRIVISLGPDARVIVEDNGPGFPDRMDPEQLLEPFAKGEESSEGSGLGLAIVKRAVDLHGGSISIGRSKLGGARIEVSFGPNSRSDLGPVQSATAVAATN